MKINSAEFIISAVRPEQYPNTGYPEIALAGRSNVGKSSFINRLINRKNLVRTSSKPGKTQTLNYYLINDQFYFVDVPGYGYAQVSKQERAKWGEMLETYFGMREPLEAVVLIVDSRHKPSEDDQQMVEFIAYLNLPLIVVATKLDKVSKGKRQKAMQQVENTLPAYDQMTIIPFSAETGENKDKAWNAIKYYL